MAKKKTKHGVYKTPRQAVQLPAAWVQVARRLAAKTPTPTTWYLVTLIRDAAIAAGETNLPPLFWEEK